MVRAVGHFRRRVQSYSCMLINYRGTSTRYSFLTQRLNVKMEKSFQNNMKRTYIGCEMKTCSVK